MSNSDRTNFKQCLNIKNALFWLHWLWTCYGSIIKKRFIKNVQDRAILLSQKRHDHYFYDIAEAVLFVIKIVGSVNRQQRSFVRSTILFLFTTFCYFILVEIYILSAKSLDNYNYIIYDKDRNECDEFKIENKNKPVWVRICLFRSEGRSKAFPHTSQGRRALSDLAGLLWTLGVISSSSWCSSLDDPADDDVRESPDTDLCSSSLPEGGDIGRRILDRREVERSNGESEI